MSAKTFETEPSEMDSDVFIENLLYLQTKSIYMKNALNILLLLFLVYLLACTKRQTTELLPELTRAESLMYDHPDSALSLLENMNPPSSSNKLQNATWSLLLVQARDKNYIKHTSDSLINVAYDYFMKQEDPNRRALVLNYEGRVNEDLGEVEKATEFYLRAADEVKKTEDYRLGALINSNLGMIYAYRSLNEQALVSLTKANKLALLSNDSNYISSTLSYLGRIQGVLRQWDKAITFYKQSSEISQKKDDKRNLSRALRELAMIYRYAGLYDSVLIYLRQSEKIDLSNKYKGIYQTYFGMGDAYRYLEQYDSSKIYLTKAIETDNIYTKQNAYQCLYYVNISQDDYKNAVNSVNQYWLYRDSAEKINNSNVIAEIQAKYDDEKLKNENVELELERSNLLRTNLFILILLLTMIGIIVFVYQRRLLVKERTIQKNKELLRQYTIQLRSNENLIQQNQDRIQELTVENNNNTTDLSNSIEEQRSEMETLVKQNERLLSENQLLHINIDKYTVSLQQKDEELVAYETLTDDNIRLRDREKFLCDQLMKQTTILKELRLSPKYIKTQGEWEDIIEAVDILYDNYTVRLCERYPSLTESDLQICCLIKLHLNNSTIATLTGISPASVTKRKQRMKERMDLDLDEKESLDMWLQGY
ncbi:tetratricopeptide repeat protein [uncultured Parabacteroides sp.]|uniref:tetratricopeptide repeat protein n=1 Tax=uncultured Parabacteroides sp. TaxID=512312 RepID=UPI002804F072|nr:tetratricopeptide repeat protein [uncultured Parabacteroides sp.]